MTTITENDLRELKDLINSRFDQVRTDIQGLDKRLTVIEATLEAWKPSMSKTADLAEKVGELKNWRSIAFLILGAVAGWIARNSMSNP